MTKIQRAARRRFYGQVRTAIFVAVLILGTAIAIAYRPASQPSPRMTGKDGE